MARVEAVVVCLLVLAMDVTAGVLGIHAEKAQSQASRLSRGLFCKQGFFQSSGCGWRAHLAVVCRGGIFGSSSSSAGSRCVAPTSSASRRPRCWPRRTPSPTPPAAARAPAPATSSAARRPTARWRPSPSSSHGTRVTARMRPPLQSPASGNL